MDWNFLFFIFSLFIITVVVIFLFVLWIMKKLGLIPKKKKKTQESYIISEEDIISETNTYHFEEYNRFEFQSGLIKNSVKNLINIPKSCPICNLSIIEGYFNYKVKNKEYIEIPLCKEHYKKLDQKPSVFNDKLDIILVFSISIMVIIEIIIYLITSFIFTIITFTSGILLFIYISKKMFEIGSYKRFTATIHEFFRVSFLKNSIIIIIKNRDWAREFKNLNNWKEILDSPSNIKTYRKKRVKWILLWILMTIPIMIILLVFFPIYSRVIIYFFVFIPTFLIIFIIMFQEAKTFGRQPLSTSKLLASIILIIFLFIFIALFYFEMIPIFQK